MKTKFSMFLCALAALVSTNVFAQAASAPAAPPQAAKYCPDEDKDGFYTVEAGCIPPVGKKPGDCDDTNSAIHPGAKELRDNGVDEDCDGSDLKTESVERQAQMRPFKVDPSNPQAVKVWDAKVKACKAASSTCIVDYTGGSFTVADGYRLVSKMCNGKWEVVDLSTYVPTVGEKEACAKVHKAKAAQNARSHRKHAPTAKVAGLPGDVTSTGSDTRDTPKAPAGKGKRGAAAVDYSAPIAKAQAAADGAQKAADEAKKAADGAAAKADAAKAAADELKDGFDELDADLGKVQEGLQAETDRAKAAEAAIDQKAAQALTTAKQAKDDATAAKGEAAKARAVAPLLEAVVSGTAIGQTAVTDKAAGTETVVATHRGYTAFGGSIGANLGVETESARYNAFGNISALMDQSGDSWAAGHAWNTGVEACAKSGSLCIGGHVLFQEHAASGSVASAETTSRGGGAGLTVRVGNDQGLAKYGLLVRLTAGYEGVSMPQHDVGGPFVGLQIGGAFGIGRDN